MIQRIFQEVKLAKHGDRLEILDAGEAGIKDVSQFSGLNNPSKSEKNL